jgi:NAD(P)H-hydrate epimerase
VIPVLTAAEMRALEQAAFASGAVSSLELQERAARGAVALLPDGLPVEVLAGPGNNGGDALAVARLLRERGQVVRVWALAPEPVWKGDAAIQAERWQALGGTYEFAEDPEPWAQAWEGRWVVDGLFGLGTRLPLPERAQAWVTALWLNHKAVGFKVLALDLPSGLDPDGGAVLRPLQADRTACFGFRKVCHALRPARDFCGELHLIDLGLEEPEPELWLMDAPEKRFWGHWAHHKRDHGHVVIRAGSLGMSGAAVLCALGALRMGAGLVTILTDEAVRAEIAAQVPEAMVRTWSGELPVDTDVLLVGPGGVSEVPAWGGMMVLDASALRDGEGPRWMDRPRTVITPHPGEFRRLFGTERLDAADTGGRLAQVRSMALGPGVLVLKGHQTLIAGGGDAAVIVTPSGHSGLSTGGSGDFLAGMIAGWLARFKEEQDEAKRLAAEAVWFHGAAADRLGPGPLLVRDLGPSLSALLRESFKVWDGDWRPLSER